MASPINTNVASLNSQRALSASNESLANSLKRLSSGLRINSAKDDAAGLAISERMTSQINGLNQAARNANDGISMAQTAEGGLASIGESLQRMRELSVQASNASNSASDRAALQAEVDQLVEQINTVATQTSFNGIKLLDGTFNAQTFQVGANKGEKIDVSSIASAKADSLGVGTTSSYQTNIDEGVVSNGKISSGGITVNGFGIGPSKADGVSFELQATVTGGTAATPNANVKVGSTAADAFADTDGTRTISGLTINGVTIDDFVAHTTGTASANTDVAGRFAAAINAKSAETGVTATTSTGSITLTAADGRDITVSGADASVGGLDGTLTTGGATTTAGGADFVINGVTIGATTIAVGSTAQEASAAIVSNINSKLAAGGVTNVTASADSDGKITLASTDDDIVIAGTITETGLSTGTSAATAVESESSAISKAAAFNAVSGQTGVSAKATATTLTGAAATTGAVAGDATDFIAINGVKLGAIAAGADASAQANNVAAAINAVSNQTGVTATFDDAGKLSLTATDGRNIAIQAGGTGAARSGLTQGTTYGGMTLSSTKSTGITLGGADLAKAGLAGVEGANAAEAKFGTGLSTVDITTASGAQNAIETIDAALQNINSSRASLGAYQNRFSSAVSNLQTSSENITASRSRIRDADFAAETANLSRAQVLQQAGTAMLAQANSGPQGVLSLLR